jgi:hypothetical protein
MNVAIDALWNIRNQTKVGFLLSPQTP